MFWIILWVGMAILVGALASGKGHGFFGWFLYGLLIWPIALIHVLAIKPDQRRIEHQALQSGTAKKCPHCGELVRLEATVCRHCHRDLPPAVPAAPAAPAEQWPWRDRT